MKSFRQGDVFFVECSSIPANATPIARDRGAVVLAYGEVTGHSHAIRDEGVMLFDAGSAGRFLRVERGATLWHEEHAQIELPPASYRVVIQREYSPGELPRKVLD